jgi:hypothetical protein
LLPLVEVAGFDVVVEELDFVEVDDDDLLVLEELLVLVDGLELFANAT